MSFICKKRKAPLMLEGLMAAVQRLPVHHEAYPAASAKLAAGRAGYGGEQELDKVLEAYQLPMEHRIFHDLSLYSHTHFQIDSLFVTPWYAVVFEVKNISGELTVLHNPPQLIRTNESGQVAGFKSPIAQLDNNCELLRDWLHARHMALPVYGAVVLAYPKQRITLPDSNTRFLFPSNVPSYLRSLPREDTPFLERHELDAFSAELLRGHRDYIPAPISEMYSIARRDIRPGVACPECGRLGMEWYLKGWKCPACLCTSRTAHHQAIRDWFLLFGGKMRNRDCREFLGIERQQTAHRLLTAMDLKREGANRNRTYTLVLGEGKHT